MTSGPPRTSAGRSHCRRRCLDLSAGCRRRRTRSGRFTPAPDRSVAELGPCAAPRRSRGGRATRATPAWSDRETRHGSQSHKLRQLDEGCRHDKHQAQRHPPPHETPAVDSPEHPSAELGDRSGDSQRAQLQCFQREARCSRCANQTIARRDRSFHFTVHPRALTSARFAHCSALAVLLGYPDGLAAQSRPCVAWPRFVA